MFVVYKSYLGDGEVRSVPCHLLAPPPGWSEDVTVCVRAVFLDLEAAMVALRKAECGRRGN